MRARKAKPRTPQLVSMKSGLEGRNNRNIVLLCLVLQLRLNEVRPRRPEQCDGGISGQNQALCLNEVRPRRPEQSGFMYRARAVVKKSQ